MLRIFVFLSCILGLLSEVEAQLVDSTKNKIVNAEALTEFYQKLAAAKEGNGSVNILHIGDSHIQAGFLTGTLRRAFQEEYGNAGRGLVFPYRLARTNGHLDVRFTSDVSWNRYRIITNDAPNVGVSGATIYTNSPFFTVQLRTDSQSEFNEIEVFGEGLEQVKLAIPKVKGKKLQPQTIRKTHVVKPGDVLGKIARKYHVSVKQLKLWNKLRSTMIRIGQKLLILKKTKTPKFNPNDFQWVDAYEHTDNSLKATLSENTFELYLIKQNSEENKEVRLYSLHLKNGGQGVTYEGIGYNGAKYVDYLNSPRFFEQLGQRFQPDFLIVSLGTNEAFDTVYQLAQFREDVTSFLQKVIAQTGCSQVLLTTPPSALRKRKYPNKKLQQYSQVLQEIAQENNYAVWDLFAVMGGGNGMKKWYKAGLAGKDRIHFTESGYRLQGELLYDALHQKGE